MVTSPSVVCIITVAVPALCFLLPYYLLYFLFINFILSVVIIISLHSSYCYYGKMPQKNIKWQCNYSKERLKDQIRLLPGEDKLAKELRSLGISESIVNVLVSESNKPEGRVRIQWMRNLIKEYHFPASHIAINVAAGVGRDAGKRNIPVRADIVVYLDMNKTEVFAVVETKAPFEKEGVMQAESYARNLGAEYHLWSDGGYHRVFKTSRYPNRSEPISRLPTWVADKPIVQRVPKTETLRPFKNEHELKGVIGFCHDLILEKLGHDPAKAFDEMTKLLFVKLYDEREVPNYYDFVVLAHESKHDVAERIRKIFDKAIKSSKYRDVFWSQLLQLLSP
jgi:type I restriction and modification enzyme subunit R-like protein